jgi:hypothetical protein
MASARKNSSSRKNSPANRVGGAPRGKRSFVAVADVAAEHPRFAICVRNKDYEASLELRKLYPVLEDEFGAKHGMIRVIDESGEDYLFPNEYFLAVSLPQAVEKRLRKIA